MTRLDETVADMCQMGARCGAVNVGEKERMASIAIGAGLAGLATLRIIGKRRIGLLSSLALATGAALTLRGVTGHCAVYEALSCDSTESRHLAEENRSSESARPASSQESAWDIARREAESLRDAVEEASNESFPASDAPAWTATSATKDGIRK